MAKYFMSGTKYEKFERMMMSPDRSAKDPPPPQAAPEFCPKRQREEKYQ